MYHSKAEKSVAVAGASFTAGATFTASIDRLGYDFVSMDLITATSNTPTNTLTVLKVTEGDTSSITSASAITNLTGGTSTGNFTIPNADSSNPNIFRIDVDCRGRKRYLFVSASPQTTQIIALAARLRRAKQSPQTTTDQGTLLTVNA